MKFKEVIIEGKEHRPALWGTRLDFQEILDEQEDGLWCVFPDHIADMGRLAVQSILSALEKNGDSLPRYMTIYSHDKENAVGVVDGD